jgi:septal ring factor EnvC (AmiA/AmiB activator)
MRLRLAAGLALTAFLLAAPAAAQDPDIDREIETHKQQLEQLKQQAEAKRRAARDHAKKEKDVLGRLRKAEEAINATERYLTKLTEREAILGAEIRETEQRLDIARRDLEARREILRHRLRYAYVHGKARTLEVLFSAGSFPGLLQRGAFLHRVLRQEKVLVGEVEIRQAGVETALAELHSKKEEVAALQQEKAGEKRQFESLRGKREGDLASIRGQRAESERAAAELDRAAEQLREVMAELERRRLASLRRADPVLAELDGQDFSRNRGRLPWPVDGRVIGEFGRHEHPKYKTVTLNNGLDIQAPAGSAVTSVGYGAVDMVKWLTGYGLSVIVNHGRGYYSIYSHLAAAHVSQGEMVNPGQALGSVGDTGSLKGTCLHFELREGRQAQNPRQWLR